MHTITTFSCLINVKCAWCGWPPLGDAAIGPWSAARRHITVRGKKALEILKHSLKVNVYKLLQQNFSKTVNFGFGISKYIDLGTKYDPTTGIYGMDFFVCLTRLGAWVTRHKVQQAQVGSPHRTKQEDAVQWFQDKFEGAVLSKAV